MFDKIRGKATPKTDKAERAVEAALRVQLARNPDNREARVQLLELLYEGGRERDFLSEAKRLRDSLQGNLDSPDWRLIASIGRTVAPESPLFQINDDGPHEQRRRLGDSAQYNPLFAQLEADYQRLRENNNFLPDLDRFLVAAANRPSSLFHAQRLSEHAGGAQIYFKREDLMAAGTTLAMAVTGQVLLAKRLGRTTVVTGSTYGQKGVVMASAAARLGLKAVVYMTSEGAADEAAKVWRRGRCGAHVERVDVSRLPYGDIRHAALSHWANDADNSFMVMGLDSAPEPYPEMGMDFAANVGRETRIQVQAVARNRPGLLVARGGDNADALGFFRPFIDDPMVRLACVVPIDNVYAAFTQSDTHAHSENGGLTNRQRRMANALLESLEFPSVRREHAWLRGTNRVTYATSQPDAAKQAIVNMATLEGIVPAIQTAHTIAWAMAEAAKMAKDQSVVINLVERVDKDIWDIGHTLGFPAPS